MEGRRAFIAISATSLSAWPRMSLGQGSGRSARIAYLGSTNQNNQPLVDALIQGLQDLGWIVGTNLVLDIRYAESNLERGALLTRELLALKPNVFVSGADAYARAAMSQDKTVPIVFIVGNDPVGLGLVKSLPTPGGNATGFSVLNFELNAKRLALLKEAVPTLRQVGLLFRSGDATVQVVTAATEQAGRRLGVSVLPVSVQGAEDFAQAFGRMGEAGVDGVMNVPDPLFLQNRRSLAELALSRRMAAAFGASEFAEAGMLMAYGTNFRALFVRAAALVDRILKGAKPANIPVEQASVYDLALNLRTARALGVSIPQTLLLQATRIIE